MTLGAIGNRMSVHLVANRSLDARDDVVALCVSEMHDGRPYYGGVRNSM